MIIYPIIDDLKAREFIQRAGGHEVYIDELQVLKFRKDRLETWDQGSHSKGDGGKGVYIYELMAELGVYM